MGTLTADPHSCSQHNLKPMSLPSYASIFLISPVFGSRTHVPDGLDRELHGAGFFASSACSADSGVCSGIAGISSFHMSNNPSNKHSVPSSHPLMAPSSSIEMLSFNKSVIHCSISLSLPPGRAQRSTKAVSCFAITDVPRATRSSSGSSCGLDATNFFLKGYMLRSVKIDQQTNTCLYCIEFRQTYTSSIPIPTAEESSPKIPEMPTITSPTFNPALSAKPPSAICRWMYS